MSVCLRAIKEWARAFSFSVVSVSDIIFVSWNNGKNGVGSTSSVPRHTPLFHCSTLVRKSSFKCVLGSASHNQCEVSGGEHALAQKAFLSIRALWRSRRSRWRCRWRHATCSTRLPSPSPCSPEQWALTNGLMIEDSWCNSLYHESTRETKNTSNRVAYKANERCRALGKQRACGVDHYCTRFVPRLQQHIF